MEPAGSTFFWAYVLFVLLAPIYKGGNRALPLLLLELAAIAILACVALRHREAARGLPPSLVAAVAILLVYPLLQLVPLPASIWAALPGHAEYAAIVSEFGTPGAQSAARPISLLPKATEYGWLALLPPLASLLACRALAPAQAVALLTAMVAFAGAEALLGLLQAASGGSAIFRVRETQALGIATGTFVNQAHLATMLGMMLPVLVGMLAYFRRRRVHSVDPGGNFAARRAIAFGSGVLMLLALIFTHSRAGIAAALAGLVICPIVFVAKRGGLVVAALIALGVALAAAIGVAPVLERFDPSTVRLSGEGRLALYAATLRAGLDFFPFGSGLATFAGVFPRYQGSVFGGLIDYAHDDYLQLFMETGMMAIVVVALLLFAYAARMRDLWQRRAMRSFTVLQLAAGIGLVPAMLHALFDFGLHMPGIAVWFATLAGVLLHPGVRDKPERP